MVHVVNDLIVNAPECEVISEETFEGCHPAVAVTPDYILLANSNSRFSKITYRIGRRAGRGIEWHSTLGSGRGRRPQLAMEGNSIVTVFVYLNTCIYQQNFC